LETRQLVTSTNLNSAKTIASVLTEWAMTNKVVGVLTGNDSTVKKAIDLLQKKWMF